MKHTLNIATSFVDEAFDKNRLNEFQLIIQFSSSDIFVAVKEIKANKFIGFEHITVQQANFMNDINDLWSDISSKSKLLVGKFNALSCVIVNNASSLVPSPLFEEGKEELYLKFNVDISEKESVLVNELKSVDARNVFSIPVDIKTKVEEICEDKVVYSHFSSALIETLVAANKNKEGKRLIAHVQASHFEVVLLDGSKLLFYNSFTYQSPEDLAYYLLFVCEQMKLNPESIEVELLGEVVKESSIYPLLAKYVRNLRIGKRDESYELSYQLQTLPRHFYYTLFSSYHSQK